MEPKRQSTERKRSLRTGQKTTRRYNLNEMRHHQRRCAALLFGARQQGSHEVPYLVCTVHCIPLGQAAQSQLLYLPVQVRWAPRRRESYYLMSERVYNDRLLMKLREQEEEERRRMLKSPMNFDFDDNLGKTRHLYDFQKLISQTSKHIKGLSFDTEYKDYEFDFDQEEKKKQQEQQGRVSESPSKQGEHNKRASKQSKVQFSDVTDYESDSHGERLRREHKRAMRAARGAEGELDMSDVELDLYSPDFEGESEGGSSLDGMDGDHRLSQLLSNMSLGKASQTSRRGRNSKWSRRNGKSGSYSSNSEGYSYNGSSLADKSLLNGEELDDGVSELGGAHKNKYCKHSPTSSMKKRAQDYYTKLPRLLRTSELREKATKLKEKTRFQPTGPFVNHECMASHKTAYERALALVRGRSLPEHYYDLWNRTSRITFSYLPGMPGTEQTVFKDKNGGERRLKLQPAGPSGMKGILGEVDMNDFYREEDELIYYIKPDELKTVVEASPSTNADSSDESDDDSDDDTTANLTRATSESYTLKLKSSLASETESSNF